MEEEISIDANNDFPVTHFFLYKDKQFPFNMYIFNCFSDYFNSIENTFEKNSKINLLDENDENADITESSVNDFINFCQKNTISLNKENAIPLHKLANKYMVSSLIKATNKYISIHKKDFVIDLFLSNLNEGKSSNNQEYEELIIKDLIEYVQDSRLLSFPFPILHRIVTKYTQKTENPEKRSDFIEFLFKCLEHFGRKGSVLFEHLKIGESDGKHLHRLLNEYSDIFDFHFINDEHLRYIYNIESELIKRTQKLNETEIVTKTDIEALNSKIRELEIENDDLRAKVEETNRSKDSQIKKIESSFAHIVDEMNEKIMEQNELIGQLIDRIEKIGKQKISCQFLGESNPIGAIAHFKRSVTLSTFDDSNLENIMKYDNSTFLNSYSSESKCYIKFDFGASKRIDLFSYLIRSNGEVGTSNWQHPRTWRIEGSNDNSHWTRLDRRVNDKHLCRSFQQHHFICQKNIHGDISSQYRYIRYVQENSWWDNNPYSIYISYFELYGDVFFI